MPRVKEVYKGYEILIEDELRLVIAGNQIKFEKIAAGKYYTRVLPYTEFSSLKELARHVVDDSPDFDTLHR